MCPPCIQQPWPLRMARPSSLQGRGVVAGGIRGVRQGVPRPQQLRGQGQAQVNAGKGPSQGGPHGTWPHRRQPGQPQGQTLATVPERPALFLSLGRGAVLRLGEAAQRAGVSPRRALLHPELSPPLRPGQEGPWGAGCPWAARRGSASARCLCRWLYEGVSRQKAEELLLRPGNHSGSFLIRESQTRRGESPRALSPVPPPSRPHWGAEDRSGAPVGLILHRSHLVATACPAWRFPGAAAPCFVLSLCLCHGASKEKNTSRLPAAFGSAEK